MDSAASAASAATARAADTGVSRLTRFRANPAYRMVAIDRLSPDRREAIGLADDPDVYGVLVPREPAGVSAVRAVDRDTALLFFTLQEAAPMPRRTWESLGEAAADVSARLVLDGVLEVEHEGKFVTSADAREALGIGACPLGAGRLAGISYEALRAAAASEIGDPAALAGYLYRYNREPLTPTWSRRIPDRDAAAAYLGWDQGSRADAIASRWARQPGSDSGWVHWRSRLTAHGVEKGAAVYKLYVSPVTEALPEALAVVAKELAVAGAFAFKIGADLDGLLRPDKLVAYFSSFETLGAASSRLAAELDGMAPQGVPFTAESSADGLLSWGVDPPASSSFAVGVESWRLWIVQQLASALSAACSGGHPEPSMFALQRLRLEGVDVSDWAPGQSLWNGATA